MAATLEVTSETFKEGELIPSSAAHQAVGGENRSPQLSWTAGPEGTKSYAVTCWDPDAPTTVGFTHWVRYDIPASQTSLEEGAGTDPGAHGFSDWGRARTAGWRRRRATHRITTSSPSTPWTRRRSEWTTTPPTPSSASSSGTTFWPRAPWSASTPWKASSVAPESGAEEPGEEESELDESLEESFPSSDPPSSWAGADADE